MKDYQGYLITDYSPRAKAFYHQKSLMHTWNRKRLLRVINRLSSIEEQKEALTSFAQEVTNSDLASVADTYADADNPARSLTRQHLFCKIVRDNKIIFLNQMSRPQSWRVRN